MQQPQLESTPIIFGGSGLFGIRTTPLRSQPTTAVIMLNAGMLPCAGPFRLHVEIASLASELGLSSVRLDQSGKGESPTRHGVTAAESTLIDYDEVYASLQQQGVERTILVGLCSGAVDALRIAERRDSVCGLVLLDGFVGLTPRWRLQRLNARLRNAVAVGPYSTLKRLLVGRRSQAEEATPQILTDLRDWSKLDMRPAYESVWRRDVQTLAVFSGGFYPYNYDGQLRDYVGAEALASCLQEVFLREADHTYTLWQHRERLLSTMRQWLHTKFSAS